jgi:hypothetical protein
MAVRSEIRPELEEDDVPDALVLPGHARGDLGRETPDDLRPGAARIVRH